MEKINLYISSKNRNVEDKINSLKINLPLGFISCGQDEYFILNVISFIHLLHGIIAMHQIIKVN